MALQDKGERITEEIKIELALVKRDLIQRLSRIEEYMSFLESDVSRLRLDLQRVNDKIQEISDKTLEHGLKLPTPPEIVHTTECQFQKPTLETSAITIQSQVSTLQPQIIKQLDKKEGINQTELAIIKYLIDNPGTKSATPIAQTISKAREHVARTLKKLNDEKKIIRDETTWPYTYVVPEEVKKFVQGQSMAIKQTSSN